MSAEDAAENVPEPDDSPEQSEVEQVEIGDTSAGSTEPALKSVPNAALAGSMDLIMDIPVTVSMELGRTKVSIRELLALNPGAVIELERLASEPMEVLVNGTLVAHGEAVKVGDKYGVRLTSVVNAGEPLNQVGT
ncbi:MAG: flagellar motor switch protein FliN [Gammaproteobacteria bacterium]|nr:flagellar motor switch protein FliN [Gammaproteobacteria bacterium]